MSPSSRTLFNTDTMFMSSDLRTKLPLLVVAFCLSFGLFPGVAPGQTTYTVTSNGTAADHDATDGVCDTNDSAGDGPCTLRAAVQEANNDPDNDTIEFDIPSTGTFTTITVNSELSITETVTIDGTTSPTYPSSIDGPTIAIDGSNLTSSSFDGIEVGSNADGTEIKGLGVNNFPDEGIDVFSGVNNVTIRDCFVGVAIDDGSSDGGNVRNPDNVATSAGVKIEGDNFALANNVISHNDGYGVYIDASASSALAVAEDNLIGLDHNGDAAAGNDFGGALLAGGTDVLFGGSAGNVISANGGSGVVVQADGHFLSNNLIGTDQSGSTATGTDGSALGNAQHGVNVLANNTSIANNTISGNDGNGIRIGSGGSSTSADGTAITDNTIGLNQAQDASLPNGDGSSTSGGIVCSHSTGSSNLTEVIGNTIAGNEANGIWITSDCYQWDIYDNYVGTNSNFATGLGNSYNGINVKSDASGVAEEFQVVENIVGNNSRDGIDIRGSEHDVADNYVGVAPNGTDIGNGRRGIKIDGTSTAVSDVAIGGVNDPGDGDAAGHGTPNGAGNVIGFNEADGILVLGAASFISIRQNYVGTDPSDADYGNGGTGDDGIRIIGDGQATSDHEVGYNEGDSFSSPHPADGGDGNVIAYNGGDAISVGVSESSTDASGVSVRGNVAYRNGSNTTLQKRGLDLGNSGRTANDNAADDADTGPNNLQNFPIIENVSYNGSTGEVSIQYRVQTTTGNAAYPLKIDFYAADNESSAEGKVYLGTQEYTSGDATTSKSNVIDLGSISGVTKDDHFVATATDADGNTSEFMTTAEPLPVELASFEATQSGDRRVTLSWSTASEQNNAGFRVQHQGPSSSSWSKVGFVDGSGTTTNAQSYRFSADDLSLGTHRFRLKQVDLDGSTHLHDPVTVDLEMTKALRLSAPAPNPVQGTATASFAVKEQSQTSVSLYNVLGEKVATLYQGTPTAGEAQSLRIPTSNLASGVYFLRLQADGQSRTQRLTVVR